MSVMEPRVAERRKGVAEDRARRRLRGVLVVIVFVAVSLGTMWLIRSPILSIREVSVIGAEESDPRAALRSLGMDIGTPTIDVNGEEIAAAVLEDPWVKTAQVDVVWPGSIFVEVVERVPVAPVRAAGGWVLVARDGDVISAIGEPGADDASITVDHGTLTPGDSIEDLDTLGALAFIDALPLHYRSGTTVSVVDGGLHAVVAGHSVRLGRPIDMQQKAVVLEALLDAGIEAGAAINLIAPLRPAVANPGPEPEVEDGG